MTKTSPVTIQSLQPHILSAFLALNEAAFPARWGERWSDQDLLGALELPGITANVACDEAGGLLGFLLVRTVLDEAEILLVGVLPEKRGKGVATTLLTDFLKVGRQSQLKKVFLEVRDSNHPARSLYSGLGFVRIGERSQYYRAEDGAQASAITLAKYLNEAHETLEG